MFFAPATHSFDVFLPSPIVLIFGFSFPPLLAPEFAPFSTGRIGTKPLVIAVARIWNEQFFTAGTPAPTTFGLHRQPSAMFCWHWCQPPSSDDLDNTQFEFSCL
jgi:hypothetical protein